MANTYSSTKTGITVVRGTVSAISDDRKKLTIVAKVWDGKEEVEKTFSTVEMSMPVDDSVKVGFDVTLAGYKQGESIINPKAVMTGNDYEEIDGTLAVITGFVSFARMNEEKDANGNPRRKQDGSEKKPHYDIGISVRDSVTGEYVTHIITVYNTQNDDKAIERAQRTFRGFDKDTNKVTVSVVTGCNDVITKEKEGRISRSCYHLGYRMLSVNYLNQKEKTNDTPQQTQAQPQTQAPVAQPTPQPTPVAQPSGFTAPAPDLSVDNGEVEFS